MSEEVGGLTDLSNRRNVLVHSFPYLHINILQKKKKKKKEKEKKKKKGFAGSFYQLRKGVWQTAQVRWLHSVSI